PLSGVITAEALEGFELELDVEFRVEFNLAGAVDCPEETVPDDDEVTAVGPEVAVEDEGSGRGILTIPDIEGIIFDLDNVPSGAGEYEVTSGDVVKATAREGFVLTNPDFEYVVEVTVNEDCVTTTVAETTTTEKP